MKKVITLQEGKVVQECNFTEYESMEMDDFIHSSIEGNEKIEVEVWSFDYKI